MGQEKKRELVLIQTSLRIEDAECFHTFYMLSMSTKRKEGIGLETPLTGTFYFAIRKKQWSKTRTIQSLVIRSVTSITVWHYFSLYAPFHHHVDTPHHNTANHMSYTKWPSSLLHNQAAWPCGHNQHHVPKGIITFFSELDTLFHQEKDSQNHPISKNKISTVSHIFIYPKYKENFVWLTSSCLSSTNSITCCHPHKVVPSMNHFSTKLTQKVLHTSLHDIVVCILVPFMHLEVSLCTKQCLLVGFWVFGKEVYIKLLFLHYCITKFIDWNCIPVNTRQPRWHFTYFDHFATTSKLVLS